MDELQRAPCQYFSFVISTGGSPFLQASDWVMVVQSGDNPRPSFQVAI